MKNGNLTRLPMDAGEQIGRGGEGAKGGGLEFGVFHSGKSAPKRWENTCGGPLQMRRWPCASDHGTCAAYMDSC